MCQIHLEAPVQSCLLTDILHQDSKWCLANGIREAAEDSMQHHDLFTKFCAKFGVTQFANNITKYAKQLISHITAMSECILSLSSKKLQSTSVACSECRYQVLLVCNTSINLAGAHESWQADLQASSTGT